MSLKQRLKQIVVILFFQLTNIQGFISCLNSFQNRLEIFTYKNISILPMENELFFKHFYSNVFVIKTETCEQHITHIYRTDLFQT